MAVSKLMTKAGRQDKTTILLPGLVNPHDLSEDRQFSMNLARGMQVLRGFTSSEPLLGNRQISDRTGLPKPTVSRLTYTLTLLGYLSYNANAKKYQLGSGLLSLGYPLLASMGIRQLARPIVEQLARDTGCTVNFGIRDRTNVVYVDTARVDKTNEQRPDIGSTRPLLVAAIGRALILACPPSEQRTILNYLKVQDRAHFNQYRSIWENDRKLFAAHGYCHSRGDWRPEIHAIGVPVHLSKSEPPMAMSCSLSGQNIPKSRLVSDALPKLIDAARRLEILNRSTETQRHSSNRKE